MLSKTRGLQLCNLIHMYHIRKSLKEKHFSNGSRKPILIVHPLTVIFSAYHIAVRNNIFYQKRFHQAVRKNSVNFVND